MSYARWSDSEWYIFWYCSGAGSDVLSEQQLAIWLNLDYSLVFDYAEAKRLHEADAWEEVFDDIPERDVLNRCVARWLTVVEEECGDL